MSKQSGYDYHLKLQRSYNYIRAGDLQSSGSKLGHMLEQLLKSLYMPVPHESYLENIIRFKYGGDGTHEQDFSLYTNILREMSEELLGEKELFQPSGIRQELDVCILL